MDPADVPPKPVANVLAGKAPAATPEAQHTQAVAENVKAAPAEAKRAIAIDQKLLMSEVQLLLADKRTAFALLRTGVTVALIPMSIWTLLVTTSKLYNVFDVLWLLVPLLLVATLLFVLGIYLVVHAMMHVRHIERVMAGLKKSDTLLEDLMFREVGMSALPSFRPWRRLRRGGPKGAS